MMSAAVQGLLGKPIWAGVAGFSAEFIHEQVCNAAVFKPCDVADAERAFNQLQFVTSPREAFVEKYARRAIMEAMASDIVAVAEGKHLLVET